MTLWAYIDERDGRLLKAGLERTIISSLRALSFAEATLLLDGDNTCYSGKSIISNARAVLTVAKCNLSLWSQRHKERNQAAQKREQRLSNRELILNKLNTALPRTKARDVGVGHLFQRSRGHQMVDLSLDLYAYAVKTLMTRTKQPIPFAAGSGTNRCGPIGTAPLQRYIDGLAQRQALSALCGYCVPLTVDECREASKTAAHASDNINNIQSSKQLHMLSRSRRQVSALYELARHLESTGGIQNRRQVSTGHNKKVVIIGVGATGRCKGVRGTLKSR